MENIISLQKAEWRKTLKTKRSALDIQEQNRIDMAILQNVISMSEFQSCGMLLTYVSMEDEVNTRDIIEFALKNGKKVAVPRTIPAEKVMEFYEIESLDELTPGKYGIPEPNANPDKKVMKPYRALCLVPGLSFDLTGNRLGYGGGYYDRYLEEFTGVTVGLCRSQMLSKTTLPHEAYDIRVRLVVTENDIIRL